MLTTSYDPVLGCVDIDDTSHETTILYVLIQKSLASCTQNSPIARDSRKLEQPSSRYRAGLTMKHSRALYAQLPNCCRHDCTGSDVDEDVPSVA